MQVMEVTVAVLDCPLMVAISDLDDVNLKGKRVSPCLVSNEKSPIPTPAIAVGHPDPLNSRPKLG